MNEAEYLTGRCPYSLFSAPAEILYSGSKIRLSVEEF
jgi:hypothetical protein